MSLIKWFDDRKKQAQGVFHQLNPFDGGRTYDTNQRGVNPGTPNPVRINDNTPGFQWSNNSLTRGLSRGFDQINPLDNNRTWQQRTPTDTLSVVQEAKRIANQPNRPDQYWDSGIGKLVNTGLAGTMRAAAGVGQDVGGLVDLITPGHGTSRFTDYWKNRGAMWDERAKEAGVAGKGYHLAQAPLSIASYATPGAVAKGVGAIPKVAKVTGAVGNVINKAPGVAKAAGYVDDLAASGNRLQRVGGKMLQSYRQPGAQIDIAFDALQNAGHRTSLGEDNSLGTAAIDAGLSIGMQGGVNLLGQGVQAAAAPVVRGLRNNNLMPPTNLTPDELYAARKVRQAQQGYGGQMDLTDADVALYTQAQAKLGAAPYSPAGTKAIDDALGAHRTYEVAKQQRRQSIQEAIERFKKPTPLGEEGFVQNPFHRRSDLTEGLSKQQAEFINDYAEMLEGMGAGNGVDITPDGRKISNNVRDADTAGRNMTKADWFEKARKDIESGKAGFGASDDYKRIPGVSKTDPLESLKAEARKYKSAEEHLAALHKQAYGVNEPVNIPAVEQTLKDIPNKVQYAQEDAAKHAQDLANLKQQLAEAQAAHLQPTGRTTLDGRPQLNDTSKIQNSLKRQISKQEKSAERYNAQAKLYQAVANKSDIYNQATAPKTKGADAVALKSEAKAVPKYMQDKVTPEGYFTEGRYKDSAYPKNFVAIEDVPSTNIKAGDKVALIKGRDGRFDAILDKSYKESSTGYTISRESYVDPSKFTNTQAPQPTKGAKKHASAIEALESPELRARWDAINKQKQAANQKVTKTSNNLYHTTKAENLDSIAKEGLVTGKPARYEGVSSKDKISFSANEAAAKYYGGDGDIMIRTKRSYKPDDLDIDPLAGGDGTYTTGKSIPPNMLEVKINGKWTPLEQLSKQPTKGASASPKTSSSKVVNQEVPALKQQQVQPSSRSTDTQPKVQSAQKLEQPLANQPSKQTDVPSSKAPVIADNSTTSTGKSLSDSEWGRLLKQADEELPTFDAVAGAAGTRNSDRLADAINTDNKITKAAKEAQRTGKELHFYAKNDANGRSVGIEQFDPSTHRIEAGFVVDQNGSVVGNHIKVDETGIQVNVGGDLVNMNRVIGSPDSWRGKYRLSDTMSRNIDRNAPNKQVAQQAKDFVVGSKVKAEANYRVELDTEFKKLGERIKTTNKAKPRGVSKKQWQEDIFDSLDGKLSDADIKAKYGDKASAILDYKTQTRELYDSLFERINAERVKFGQRPIDKRQDYITHLQELSGNKSFTGEVYTSIKNSFTDEGMQKTRGGVPGEIAGRTENFQPRSAYNRFLQRRTGDKAVKDPFAAVQAYLEPALYNIHMTEATVRARAVEAAFRTASQLKNMSADGANKQLNNLLDAYKGGNNSKLITGFQEYANALAKKTQRWDRQIIDASDASATALKGWQGLQRAGGRATILGNVSSTMAQPLNQVITLADAGPVNYMKGVAAALSGDKAIQKSSFIRARATKAVAPIRSKGTKILDAGGIPLEKVEMASVKNTWHAMHAKAKSAGKSGMEAIKQADYDTERLVAGRGIADKPEVYRSTLANGVLQYTLEVNAQNKAFWKDLTLSQKATFVVAAAGVNSMMETITGFEPLPDFLGAALDTGKDFVNSDDDRTAGEKVVGGAQRMAGEYVGMNPIASAGANAFMTQDMRRKVFGSDSDLGRFEGTAAPVQVVKNVYRAGESAMKGNWTDARNSIMRTVPFGNQIRKTLTGAEANAAGHAVDRNGKKTFETGSSNVDKAKNLLFGPSSTSGDYYDKKKTGSKDSELKQIAATTIRDEKGNIVTRDKYDTIIDAYKKNKDGTIRVNDYDTDQLRSTIKDLTKEYNSTLKSAGLREIKGDSRHAIDYAKFVKSIEGKDDLEVERKTKTFFRKTYINQMDKRTQAFYGLSDTQMLNAINSGKITKKQLEKAIETDNYLTEKGLQSYLQIGKKLRRALGIAVPGGSGGSGGGRGGGRKKGVTKADLSMYQKAAQANAYIKPPSLNAPQVRKVAPTAGTQIKRKISTSTAAPKITVRKGTA